MRGHRLAETLQRDTAKRFAPDVALDEPVGRITREDASGLGTRLEPRGEVRRLADRSVVHAQVVADAADDHDSCVEPDTQSDLDAAFRPLLLGESADRLLDGDLNSPLGQTKIDELLAFPEAAKALRQVGTLLRQKDQIKALMPYRLEVK